MPQLEMLWTGPPSAPATLLLAHGAGAPMDSVFMEFFAREIGESGVRVGRFEFPYMAARRGTHARRPPDREPVLRATWLAAIAQARAPSSRLFIGGKSLGGRIASLVADEAGVSGLVCLGYPFHPPQQPARLRTRHLESLQTPMLIVQGERDAFGSRDEVAAYALSPAIRVRTSPDGDHGLTPRKSSGRTEEQSWREAVGWVVEFVKGLT